MAHSLDSRVINLAVVKGAERTQFHPLTRHRPAESAEISCEHLVAPPDVRKVGIPSDLLILHAPQSAIGGYKRCEKKW